MPQASRCSNVPVICGVEAVGKLEIASGFCEK
jgi:hypothetical protein